MVGLLQIFVFHPDIGLCSCLVGEGSWWQEGGGGGLGRLELSHGKRSW